MNIKYYISIITGAVWLAAALLSACNGTPTHPSPQPDNIGAASPAALALLAPLYYLHSGQVWRLERDGTTRQQITHENEAVESFDVSQRDGALVYVTGNSLVYCDDQGNNRRMILSGPALPAVEDELAALNDQAIITGRIASPAWSPDGERVAYIQNGLNVIPAAGGEVQVLHANDSMPQQGEANDRLVIASILSWSPDGKNLLLVIYRYPLTSNDNRKLAIKAVDGYLTTVSEGYRSTTSWSPDSQYFYIANASIGLQDSLKRCTSDGRCALIGQYVSARTSYFYTFPHATGTEEIYYFMGTSPDPQQPPPAFRLYKARPDGYGVSQMRAEEYTLKEALWAKDSSGALIVPAGSQEEVLWLPVDGSEAVQLPIHAAQRLRWGVN